MPRYVIHIGPPKTGSKYIQSQLFHSRQFLLERGICYPDLWWSKPDQILHDPLFEELQGNRPQKAKFDLLNAAGHKTIVLSCEGFDDLTTERLESLRDAIGEHPVEIVYYVRRWSERIPSDWRQRNMMGQFQTFPAFYIFYLTDPEGTGEINYSLVWRRYAAVFGRDSIRLVSHNNLRDKKIDTFEHFCKYFLGLDEVPVVDKNLIQSNISPDVYESEILRALNFKHYLEVGRIEKYVRVKFLMLKDKLDFSHIKPFLQQDIKTVKIADNAQPLETSWLAMKAFLDRMVSPEYGDELFVRQKVEVPYVGSDYLMRKGALERLDDLYKVICDAQVVHPELE